MYFEQQKKDLENYQQNLQTQTQAHNSSFKLKLLIAVPVALGIALLISGVFGLGEAGYAIGGLLVAVGVFAVGRNLCRKNEDVSQNSMKVGYSS